MLKYKRFKKYENNYEIIYINFPKDYYINKNNLEAISSCIFSLKHGRHPIIAGNIGQGKKLLTCKLGDYFNERIAEKEIIMENDEIFPDYKNITTNCL